MIFVEIEYMLDKLKATDRNEELIKLSLSERLKWCFPKQHVTYLLAHLESLRLSLIVLLQILRLGNVMKAKIDGGTSPDALASTDDVIAQEKAESQNMIIVRYWCGRRLERLWDTVQREAIDAAKDPTNQKINANYCNTAPAVIAAARSSDPTRLPVVTFGDCDNGLSDMERSPRDMVHLSESTMNRLLSAWVPLTDPSRLSSKCNLPKSQLKTHVSDSDEGPDKIDFDGHDVQGYYLEGKTDDWRHPRSQEARQHAAKLREQYSKYQPRVDNESEPAGPKHQNCDRNANPSEEHRSHKPTPGNMRRPHSQNLSDPKDRKYPYPKGSSPRSSLHVNPQSSSPQLRYQCHSQPQNPSQNQNQTYAQPHNQYKPQLSTPRSPISAHHSTHSHQRPAPLPTAKSMPTPPRPQTKVHFEDKKQKPRPHPLSKSSSETSVSDSKISPPRSAQRSPTNRREEDAKREEDRKREEDIRREEARQRHKTITRNAAKGLVGVGAIAGFMDALEAFSVL